MRLRSTIRLPLAVVAVCAAALVGANGVGASPVNSPDALTGTFFDCSNGASGTFVVNSGNAQANQTWNVAHLTFSSGGTGVFIPTTLALSYNGMTAPPTNKGSAQGSVTCSIAASGPGFTLTGTVTGNIVGG
jgi:hypothetical protein